MIVTILLTVAMMALLFLMIWGATYFLPWKGLMDFFPADIKEKALGHKPPFRTAPVFGWIAMCLCLLGMIGTVVYGGWDGIQRGYGFGQFLVRFLVIFFGVKVFDIVALDYFLITKSHFFQHYFPETEGCAGYHQFGFNRKQQLRQIVVMPFAALLTAWICSRL